MESARSDSRFRGPPARRGNVTESDLAAMRAEVESEVEESAKYAQESRFLRLSRWALSIFRAASVDGQGQ